MKPPKPRIAKPRLVWKYDRRKNVWVPYHRVSWREGDRQRQKTVKLDWKGDAALLDELYWRCQAGNHERQQLPAKYTWRELVIAWRTDPRIQGRLADSTKVSYRRTMDAILMKNAAKDVRHTTRQGVRAIHDSLAETPRKADWYIQTISLLWNYAKNKRDWPLGDNPASGIDLFGKQREFLPWPEWLVNKLDTAPDNVRAAAELIRATGQRPNAAITMRFDHFHGETMTVLDEKGGEFIEVFCPPALRQFIADRRRAGAHVLAKNLTAPLGYDAIEKAFRTWRNGLGPKAKPFTLHGLRKLAIVQLAEAGCTDAEIQAVTNQSAEMVAYYRSKASRLRLSKSAQERRT
ncbi:tyrosine-type recombinase/integrase [Arenibacterium halophilum]|uniref:Tyr recombinase domain-containing protein n=1 Tax=Arenibacterium halophilum TaxID=2583821 RepID=A0ABY2XBQ4_9RHOB|nr:tyrosine-type recombinase/integrase [Arenibacterium halophilum]TMV14434.1 hypothetical protein FGK64_00105 [Arenibacterium halophilum]